MPDVSPKISIITIVRNAPEDLARTIASVLAQNVKPFEHLIIDGFSSDDRTVFIAEEYFSANSDYVRFLSEKDDGISDALNKGVKLALGDYVLCLNAGDELYDSGVLQFLNEEVRKSSENTVLYGDAVFVHPKYEYIGIGNDHMRLNSFFHFWNPICHQAMIVPRSLMLLHPFGLSLRYSMDLECWLSLMDSGIKFLHLDAYICRYYLGGVSSNPQNIPKLMREHLRVYYSKGRWYKAIPALYEYLKYWVKGIGGEFVEKKVKLVRTSR